jgi:hypothetical protein
MSKEKTIQVELGGGKKSSPVAFTKDIVKIGSKYYYKNSDLVTLVRVGSKRRYFRAVSPLIEQIDGVYYKKSTVADIDGVRTSIYAQNVVKCKDGYHLRENSVQLHGQWYYKHDPEILNEMVKCDYSGKRYPKDECIQYVKIKSSSGLKSSETVERLRSFTILDHDLGQWVQARRQVRRVEHTQPQQPEGEVRARPLPDDEVRTADSVTFTTDDLPGELLEGLSRTLSEEVSKVEEKVNSELTDKVGYVHNKFISDLVAYEENYYRQRDCVVAYDSKTGVVGYVPKDIVKKAPSAADIFWKFDSDWSGDLSRARSTRYIVDHGEKGKPKGLVKIQRAELPFTRAVVYMNNYLNGADNLYIKEEDLELFTHCVLFFVETQQGTLDAAKMTEYARVVATNNDFDPANLSLDFRNSGASDRWVNSGNNKIAKTFDRVADLKFTVGIEVETSGGSVSDNACKKIGVAKAGDRSIGAYEYITPILRGNSIDTTIQSISREMQGKVMFDKRCSTHVHVGAAVDERTQERMMGEEFTSAALRLGAHLEDEWFGIMPKFRYNTRFHCYSIKPYRGINSKNYNNLMGAYCHGDHESQMTQYSRENDYSLKNGRDSTSRWHGARYKWLNLVGLLKPYGSSTGEPIRTVEFRLFPGTVNQEELFLYVMMSMCFVEFALNHQKKIMTELYDVNSELIFNTVIKDHKIRRRVISLYRQLKSINKTKLA